LVNCCKGPWLFVPDILWNLKKYISPVLLIFLINRIWSLKFSTKKVTFIDISSDFYKIFLERRYLLNNQLIVEYFSKDFMPSSINLSNYEDQLYNLVFHSLLRRYLNSASSIPFTMPSIYWELCCLRKVCRKNFYE